MDPITFSIIRHRLYRVIDEAVITLKHVSGSAITNEGHDLMVSLYRRDGSLLMGGVGFLHHLTSAAEACKAIIRRFEGRINAGDVFLTNCPYTAALHTSDVYLVAPIHYDGELVAWSACFVHVYDIGAMVPGGFSPDSRDIFTEGFSSPGLKLVEGGEMNTDIMDTLLNMVRAPEAAKLVRALESHDVAIADRFAGVDEGGASQPPLRKLISKGSRLWVRWFLGLPFADTQCGAKAFRTAAWRRVAPRVTERGWAFDLDVLAHVQAMDLSVAEVPVRWRHIVEGSKIRPWRDVPSTLLATLRIRHHIRRSI